MRVTSELWVSALLKRIFGEGGFAAVRRRGAHEAGAVFVIRRLRTGELELYAPAPQTSYDEARPSERQFLRALVTADENEMERRLERETRFDPDVWLVEIETADEAGSYLTLASE